jgi:methionyl-tRNA synthetase
LYVSIQIIKTLAIVIEPFIPFTAKELRTLLNLPNNAKIKWSEVTKPLEAGHKVNKAKPLFSKIDSEDAELQENLEKIRMSQQKISYEYFSKLDLRIGKITKGENIPKSANLVKLLIDIGGGEIKQAIAGIAKYYEPKELEGRNVAIIVNLQPRQIFGLESQVMILATEDDGVVSVLQPDRMVKTGSKIK